MTTVRRSLDTLPGGRRLTYEPSLDGLRGISIAGVVVYHACSLGGLSWARGGFLGVSVFFTLSGFLITSLLLAEHDRTGRIALGNFWARRIRRLAPTALIVMAAVALISATTELLVIRRADLTATAWSFTNWHVIALGPERVLQSIGPLGPTWSLSVEEQFYAALVLVVVMCLRTARPRQWLFAVCVVGWLGSIAAAVLTDGWQPRLEFGTDTRAAEFLVGVALAVARGTPAGQLEHGALAWLRRRGGDRTGAVALAVIVVMMLVADFSPPWLLRGGFAGLGVLSAIVIAGLLHHGRLAAALSWPPLVKLGGLSYSLYLVHWPTMLMFSGARLGFSGVPLAMVDILAAIAVAAVIHLAVEQPMRRRTTMTVASTVWWWLAASIIVTVLGWVVL